MSKDPYVCNGCKSRTGCRKEKYTYYARKADDLYKELKSNARKGINLTPEEVYIINTTLTPLIKKDRTINHLYINYLNHIESYLVVPTHNKKLLAENKFSVSNIHFLLDNELDEFTYYIDPKCAW